jgi:hypothetical protein
MTRLYSPDMSRVAVLALLIGTILVVPAGARADPQTANRIAAEADALAQTKDFLGAAAKFREAYAADPRPDLICNVGVAYHKAQELPRAQLYLSRCLERGSALRGKFIDDVRTAMSRLEASLKSGRYTPVDVVVEPRIATVAIDAFAADETFEGGRTIWLAFGTYQVTVRADGYRSQTVPLITKDRVVLPLRVTLEREAVVAPPQRDLEPVTKAPQAGPDAVGSTTAPERPTPAPAASPRPSMVPAIAATAATVALASFAVIARLKAGDHADHARFALDGDSYASEADATRRWNTFFGVGLAVAGASAVASGYFWYRVVKAPSSTAPRLEVSRHGASITLGGQF